MKSLFRNLFQPKSNDFHGFRRNSFYFVIENSKKQLQKPDKCLITHSLLKDGFTFIKIIFNIFVKNFVQ